MDECPARLLLVMVLAVGAVSTAFAQTRPYLEVAVDAAKWVRASGIRTEQALTWPADPRDSTSVGPSLYSGSPGVVLFLLDLHRATGAAEYLAEARSGADDLLARLDAALEPGLYTGLAGIGTTLLETAQATGDAKYRDGAARVVRLLRERAIAMGDGVQWNDTTDIIAGSAGIGLFLAGVAEFFLELHRVTKDADLAFARRVTRQLLSKATRDAQGTRWVHAENRREPANVVAQTGWMQGAAGIGAWLLRLDAFERGATTPLMRLPDSPF